MESKKNPVVRVTETISACVGPIIPVLVGCGLIKLLVMLVGMTGVFSRFGETETLLTCIDSAPFYFLPMLLAYSSAVYFGCSPALAMASVAVMLFPDFVSIMDSGTTASFLGIPVLSARYSYTVIPVIVLIWVMKYVEALWKKWLPAALKDTFVPMLTLLITGLLGILAVGPAISVCSNAITDGMTWLQMNHAIAARAIMCCILPVLVMTGTHFIFVAIMLEQLGSLGMESGFHVSCFVLMATVSAATLVVALKSRGDIRKKALSTGLTLLTTGISEPALFGICLPLRVPLITAMIGGIFGGIWQGMHTLFSYIFTSPSIFSFVMFYSPDAPGNLPNVLISGAIGFVASAILTAIFYREPKEQP